MKKKSPPPLVSVIIPAYNFGRFLLRALNSVRDQTYSNFEICLTNDGSTDQTDAVVKQFIMNNPDLPFSYIVQDKQGTSAARNSAVARSRGEFLCFLDADDVLKPDGISTLVGYKEKYPGADIISGGCEFIIYDQKKEFSAHGIIAKEKEFIPAREAYKRLFYQNMMGLISILVTREIFDRINGFDENIKTSVDRDFFLRATRNQASVLLIPEILGVVYKYPSGLSRKPGQVFKNARRNFKKNKTYLMINYPDTGRKIYRKAIALRHLLVFGIYRSSGEPFRYLKMLRHFFGIIWNMPSLIFSRTVRKKVISEHTNFTIISSRKPDGIE